MSTEAAEFYQAYKAERIERYREHAAKARARAEAAFSTADRVASFIPMGQPILIGHHSEKRHRRDLDRIDRGMRRGIDEDRKAAYWEHRATSAENNTAISSRDPEAITLIKARVAVLESRQARMKAINAAHGRYIKNPASLDGADFPESVKESIRNYTPSYSWEPHPYPPYALTNNGANIRRLKGRISDLERRAATVAAPDVHLESGVTITEDAGRDSVNIRFPGKPPEEVRGRLKAFGFRWGRTEGTWYARRSNRTTHALGILFPERERIGLDFGVPIA